MVDNQVLAMNGRIYKIKRVLTEAEEEGMNAEFFESENKVLAMVEEEALNAIIWWV